jgi:hypothetical protein
MPDPLVWLPESGRYRDPATGRYISRAAVRRALEESLVNLERRTDTLQGDLRARRISLTDWRDEMRLTIKQTQMAAHEIAHGGRAQMTQADYGRVGQAVRRQYEYLENWVHEIEAGAPIDGRMEPRAALYLKSGRTAFLQAEQQEMARRGITLVRNILHASESCAQCIAETAKGLVPISHLSLPGQRTCLGNCRCTLEYEKAA